MSIVNLILGVNIVTVLYLIVMTVYRYYEMCLVIILKCNSYYKWRQLYYKMRQLLQNVTFITNCDSTRINPYIFSAQQVLND